MLFCSVLTKDLLHHLTAQKVLIQNLNSQRVKTIYVS